MKMNVKNMKGLFISVTLNKNWFTIQTSILLNWHNSSIRNCETDPHKCLISSHKLGQVCIHVSSHHASWFVPNLTILTFSKLLIVTNFFPQTSVTYTETPKISSSLQSWIAAMDGSSGAPLNTAYNWQSPSTSFPHFARGFQTWHPYRCSGWCQAL